MNPTAQQGLRRGTLVRWFFLLALVMGAILVVRMLPTHQYLNSAKEEIERLGMWGPVVLGLVYVLAALLFVPGSLLTITAGAVYGLVTGTIIVSLASTTAAALAFLIARYLARERVRRRIAGSPQLAAVDRAIGQQGWQIVFLLRLSPAVPFNLQNYLYGVTAIRFWPCVLTSWVAMLPGTFLYVYLGSVGAAATQQERSASAGEWALRLAGLLATVAVTWYVSRLARQAIRKTTAIENDAADSV